MATDPSFPPALKDLAKSGIGVAAAPTGGMGLALDPNGQIPLSIFSSIPRCELANSGVQSINSGAFTALTFDTENFDPHDLHSTTALTSRITIKADGFYGFWGRASWSANPTNGAISLYLNGAEAVRQQIVGDYRSMILSTEGRMVAGSYLELVVQQSSGVALNISGQAFACAWLAPN